jgi:hypothetical protein
MILDAHGGRLQDVDPDPRREYARITLPCASIAQEESPNTEGPS